MFVLKVNTTADEIIVEARKGNKNIQRIFYLYCEYLANTVLYRYKYVCDKIGLNREDRQYVLNESVFKILLENKDHYENFPAYFRINYEFCLRELIRKISRNFPYLLSKANENCEIIDDYYAFNSYTTTGDYMGSYINEQEIKYALNTSLKVAHPIGCKIVSMVGDGYSLNEASKMLGITYYHCRNEFDNTVEALKKEIDI